MSTKPNNKPIIKSQTELSNSRSSSTLEVVKGLRREKERKREEKWGEVWKHRRTNSLKNGVLLEKILSTISDGLVVILLSLVSSGLLFLFWFTRESSENSTCKTRMLGDHTGNSYEYCWYLV